MRILVCSWGNICEPDLALSLADMGHKVNILKEKIKNKDYDLDYLKLLSDKLLKDKYDCVFSINFVPIISRVCNVHQIKYISWTVDSPLFQFNSDTIQNPCNYIFIFDRTLYNQYKDKMNHIYYMPLGANVRFWDSILLTEKDLEKFKTDVSFVGSLYEDKHVYDKVEMPEYLKGYFDGIIEAQTRVYGYNFLNDVITDEAIDEFCNCANWSGFGQDYNVSKRDIVLTEFIGKKCAEVERVRLVSEMAKNYKFDLYTLSNTNSIPHVNNKGPADSRIDMPKVFKCSKININMTIKTIESGIPQRIYDIMGNGGFVITNYQSELLEYFVPDEDLVIYESLEDLLFKISYYLQHEDERKRIAENGYKKVKLRYTVEQRLKDIIEIVWQDKSKCYGTNNNKSKMKYQVLLEILRNIQVANVLDVGLFLQQCNHSGLIIQNEHNDKYYVDGVPIVYSLKEEDSSYRNVFQLNQLMDLYDIIIMINILKCLDKDEIIYILEHLRQFSQIILIDYEEVYLEIIQEFKEWSTQKIQAGECELLLITVN